MKPIVAALIGVLVMWMLACAICGYHRRFVAFLAIALGGIALNIAWMVIGLDADPFGKHALVAHAAASLYAISSVLTGWVVGRVVRRLREKAPQEDMT